MKMQRLVGMTLAGALLAGAVFAAETLRSGVSVTFVGSRYAAIAQKASH